MITKERLEELIEQGATIWCPYYMFDEEGIQLDNKDYIDGEILYVVNEVWKDNFRKQPLKLEYLFETEEDARWELEMTATRTETLRLPSWEEIKKEVGDCGTYIIEFNSENKSDECALCINASYKKIVVMGYKSWDLTKENYIEACKLCLKLFKGEEV